ncbi:hypothetical protein HK097_009200 [Rhizophlyctis rosea]|uniref:Ankyrin repeat protein n=1 Tax=Rhizophlyctis rosea TaxID=64517 RepID=A0AAD5X3E6_9FUNG|nr:hypothetical protein HK097_009200 [Rhizophlyctis rosea]
MGRVDVLEQIEAEGLGTFAYCAGNKCRWKVAIRLGVIMRKRVVVEYALMGFPAPVPYSPRDGHTLRTALRSAPDMCRYFGNAGVLDLGATSIAAGTDDVPMLRILIKHGAVWDERRYTLSTAIQYDAEDTTNYLLRHDPTLETFAALSAAYYDNVHFLQTRLDARRRGISAFVIRRILEEAAYRGNNATIRRLLQPGNRDLIRNIRTTKAQALRWAVTGQTLAFVPSLVESDEDIIDILKLIVSRGKGGCLGVMLRWIENLNSTFRVLNPYQVPIQDLVLRAIDRHQNNPRGMAEIIPVLWQHVSEAESVALRTDVEVGWLVSGSLWLARFH